MAADKSLESLSKAVQDIAKNSPRIQSDVKDIRDAICGPAGILESITYLAKKLDHIQKRNTIDKLAGKNTNRTVIKNTNNISSTLNKILEQVKRISGKNVSRLSGNRDTGRREINQKGNRLKNLSMTLDIIERLRGVRLKDFIFAKRKIKSIRKIMSRFLATFRMFKNQKEVNGTLNFADSSIDIMKKLSKVFFISKTAELGAKAIQRIFLGKKREIHGGIIDLFRKISKNKRHIERGNRSMKLILSSCGSMLLTSIILTGIAAVAVPAMLGALLMKGVVWLLVGTYKFLGKSAKSVAKGSLVLLVMSASVISFALGLGLMVKAVKNMKLKDVGLMIASLAGIGLAVAGIGLLALPIAIGSATLLLLGASLGVFGLAVSYWKNIDTKASMNNIKLAVEGLRETFGLELGKGDEKKTFGQRLTGGLMDIAMSVLNFGSSFFIMGQLLLAGAALGLLYKGLKNWDNFNGVKAAKNLKIGIGAVKDAFGIEDKKGKKESLKDKIKKLGGGILNMGISLLQGGKVLTEMATITIATGMADVIRLTLIPWNKYNAKPAAQNLKIAFNALKDAFGLNDKNDDIKQKGLRLVGGALDMASTLLDAGGVLSKMGTIMLATGLADVIKLNLKPWEDYDASNAVTHLSDAIGSLKSIFGLDDRENEGLGSKVIHAVGSIFDLATSLLQSGGVFAKMGTITLATGLAGKIKEYIMPWENYKAENAITNIGKAVNGLLELFGFDPFKDKKEEKNFWGKLGDALGKIGSVFTSATDALASMAKGSASLAKVGTIGIITDILSNMKGDIASFEHFNVNFKSTIDSINALDVSKAATVVDVFKSFSNVKEKPIDAFTKAVDKFSNSCTDLINSLNNFNSSNNKISVEGQVSSENISNGNVNINNKDELADAIAKAIKAIPVNVRTDISDVKLVVNGEAGRRVVITLDN